MNFWHSLPKPFFVLAPMEAVTDTVFRHVVERAAPPDVYFTEFVNSTSFCSPEGAHSTRTRLLATPDETSLVAQIWGTQPEHFAAMATSLAAQGYKAIDINMGCPDKNITSRGACSALIETPSLAQEIIAATKEGGLPVSVKTRVGFKYQKTEEWLSFLLEQDIAALTVHGRTAKEMSKVPARWEEIGKVVSLRDSISPSTIVIGNGDVMNRQHGEQLAAEYGLDGIMIGRGIFQNVFCFEKQQREHSQDELFALLHFHLDLFDTTWQGTRTFEPLKRFFKIYIKGFPGANELRATLMETHNTKDARKVLADFINHSR